MVSKSIISVLALASALSTTSALPSRSHCRCTIVDASKPYGFASGNPEKISPPSHSSYRSVNTFPSRPRHDACLTLGPELENFKHTNPKAYSDFLAHSASTEVWVDPKSASPTETESSLTTEETPISTTVLLHMAARKGLQDLGVVLPSMPTGRPHQRIVCRPEHVQSFKSYQDSAYMLLALQVIVAFAFLAAVVEGATLMVQWFRFGSNNTFEVTQPLPVRPALRLSGDEKLLRAFPATESVFSPGVDKKFRAYRSATWSPSSHSKKVFEAWVDEDDEANRPVM
ncbi:hypothetical protein P280DRAFT_477987 [Massarina eburnea CBS 473.64]|uniref:Ig-like domain-containing protein n=1 Tax=Massarina eburnea CBS 473.64 TaxID=1395130 RepID=A0A6A6SAE9_9PLEO|nr:hypothetical protein P280DRAFT_477987 [Massarina eburnea CBS 473.64]